MGDVRGKVGHSTSEKLTQGHTVRHSNFGVLAVQGMFMSRALERANRKQTHYRNEKKYNV